MTQTAPYGLWESPITPQLIVGETVGLEQAFIDEGNVYWLETRPCEAGRAVIVKRESNGENRDIIEAPFSARTRAHEYGGGAFTVHKGVLYFTNDKDQRIYSLEPGIAPQPITPLCPHGEWRFADLRMDAQRARLIAIREWHNQGNVLNHLVSLSLRPEENLSGGFILAEGADFYASPTISPDGKNLAWISWDHPNMPWDNSFLWVGEFNETGMLVQRQCVAGFGSESIFQPLWSPQGELYFVSDRSGWWNMYRWQAAADAEPLLPKDAEFGKAQWEFNMATYGFLSTQRLVCAFCQYGVWHLGYIDLHTKRLQTFKMPYTDIKDVRVDAEHRTALIIAGSPTEAHALIQFNLNEIENKGKQLASAPLSLSAAVEQQGTHRVEVLRSSSQIHIEEGYLSVPQEINFPSQDGQRAYAFYYPPRNQDFTSLPNEKPPLLVMSHGGPTYATGTALSLKIQFWTSRGFAVVDVNYGGSSGYGRVYRQRLNGKWGIVDVDDCIQAARYLVEQGKADAERLLIRGGSAGGYTTLCAITFHNVFKAAASYYGVSDLESLARDTHKFESHYLHSLIAPYPEEKHIFQERSPLHYIDRLSCPVIFFQGKKDRVVPLDQAERMVEALRHRNVEVEYVLFEQEGHGFRSSEAIQQSLEKEFAFYLRILGIR